MASTIIHEPRYTIEQAPYGWDVIDSQTGESVGVCPDERTAKTRAQTLSALYSGNAKRLANAEFKAGLTALGSVAGAERLAALLEDPPELLLAMQVLAALLSVKRIGRCKAGEFLGVAGVRAHDRRVRDLTARQRAVLAHALRAWALSYQLRKEAA